MIKESWKEVVNTVVIVGAGVAGLQAANILLEHETYRKGDLKVVVLEARDRVGGRLHVDSKWGVPFDLGNFTALHS